MDIEALEALWQRAKTLCLPSAGGDGEGDHAKHGGGVEGG
jgi:hypothetical protein